MTHPLAQAFFAQPYQGYVYGYPHKSAYRRLPEPQPLAPLWAAEDRRRWFLYVHIPFCEMRCGFCNLFTQANPADDARDAYLRSLQRQIAVTAEAVGAAEFAALALGGGTPTYLSIEQLAQLFDWVNDNFGVRAATLPSSVETSPATATPERLALLSEQGVERVSIGVQSFIEAEAKACGRYQRNAEVEKALLAIRDAAFPLLNVDLIYGIAGQDSASWAASLAQALSYQPEALYLYPLYVRPLTGLSKRQAWNDQRLQLYRQGRDTLLAAGYQQLSMRHFRHPRALTRDSEYACQEDGMLGLGCGARSYTRSLHYSHEYAVSARSVEAVLQHYQQLSDADFAQASYGIVLDEDERRRRYLLKSLLHGDGLSETVYQQQFGSDPAQDWPQLVQLQAVGLAQLQGANWKLNAEGLMLSDSIGPWLFSEAVQQRMCGFDLR